MSRWIGRCVHTAGPVACQNGPGSEILDARYHRIKGAVSMRKHLELNNRRKTGKCAWFSWRVASTGLRATKIGSPAARGLLCKGLSDNIWANGGSAKGPYQSSSACAAIWVWMTSRAGRHHAGVLKERDVALSEELLAEEGRAAQSGQAAPVGKERRVPVRLPPLPPQQPRRVLLLATWTFWHLYVCH